MEIETKNNSEILSGDSLESFFTKSDAKEKDTSLEEDTSSNNVEEVIAKVEEKSDIGNFFDKSEEKKEVIKEESSEKKEQSTNNNFYSDLIKDYIEDGDWEDADVEIEVDGEVTVVPLTELKDVDKETFKLLKEKQKELKQLDIDENYVSKKGLDDTALRMIELKKAGGDLTELIKEEVNIMNPLKQIDLKNESHQAYLVKQKLMYQGVSESVANKQVQELADNFKLDDEATSIYKEIETNFNDKIEANKKAQLDAIENAKEEQKVFKKQMAETFKSMSINDTGTLKNLVNKASSYDDNGITEADKAYFEAKKNPELYAKITLLMTDEESFNKLMGTKIKNKVTKDVTKVLMSLKRKTGTQSAVTPTKKTGTLEDAFNE